MISIKNFKNFIPDVGLLSFPKTGKNQKNTTNLTDFTRIINCLNTINYENVTELKTKGSYKKIKELSFDFCQNDFLDKLIKLIPEIGVVLITQGNKEEAREFIEGLCVSLSAHYMIEEHMHGPGGGKAYMKWLTELVSAYVDNESRDVNDIKGIQKRLQRSYRRQLLGPVIKDLLNLQYSSDFYFNNYNIKKRQNQVDKAKALYEETFKKNGLEWKRNRKNDIFEPEKIEYKHFIDSLRPDKVNENIYLSFMSTVHAMSIAVHKLEENQHIWSFYDPNFGAKAFDNYSDFRIFMNEYYDDLKSF